VESDEDDCFFPPFFFLPLRTLGSRGGDEENVHLLHFLPLFGMDSVFEGQVGLPSTFSPFPFPSARLHNMATGWLASFFSPFSLFSSFFVLGLSTTVPLYREHLYGFFVTGPIFSFPSFPSYWEFSSLLFSPPLHCEICMNRRYDLSCHFLSFFFSLLLKPRVCRDFFGIRVRGATCSSEFFVSFLLFFFLPQ